MSEPTAVDLARQRIFTLVGEDYPLLNAIVDLEAAITDAAIPSLRAAMNAIATESIPRGMSVQAYRKAVLRRLDAALARDTASPPTDT